MTALKYSRLLQKYNDKTEGIVGSFGRIPFRYFLLVWAMIGLMINSGTRSCFALVMTHISNTNTSVGRNDLFPNCTTVGEESFELSYDVDVIAFFHTTYFVGALMAQVPGGIIATRFSPKRVVGYGMMVNCAIISLMPLAIRSHVASVLILRLINGILEMGTLPAMLALITSWAPSYQKTMFMSFVCAGQYLSPALAMFSAGATTCYLSWHSIFFIVGGFGALWSVMFLYAFSDVPRECPFLTEEERNLYAMETKKLKTNKISVRSIPWKSILKSKPVYALFVGDFTKSWVFSLMGTQIQEYFSDAFGLNTATIGTLSAVPDLFMFTVAIGGGLMFDFLLNHRCFTMTRGRKLFQCTGAGVEGVCLLALCFVDVNQWKVAFALLCVGIGTSGLCIPGYEANIMDLAPQYTAFLSAVIRFAFSAGILSTSLVGVVVGGDPTVNGWQIIFAIAGSINLLGAIFYGVFASGEVQTWSRKTDEEIIIFKCDTENGYGSTDSYFTNSHANG